MIFHLSDEIRAGAIEWICPKLEKFPPKDRLIVLSFIASEDFDTYAALVLEDSMRKPLFWSVSNAFGHKYVGELVYLVWQSLYDTWARKYAQRY